jgi:HPt (histidine-containing phosphotransfer) domain-containing protein
MAELVSVLIRVTGFEPAPLGRLLFPEDTLDTTSMREIPGLDVASALTRLSGMTSLYIRTAREFSSNLSTAVFEFRSVLQTGAMDRALMQMHTLKGNAGTLGATLLAAEAGRIEKLCKPPADLAMCLAQVDGLEALAQSTRELLHQAISMLEDSLPPSQTGQTQACVDFDSHAALAALDRLMLLLAEADMHALEEFAQVHQTLSGLPEVQMDALEMAMQDLEFDAALAVCLNMAATLRIEAVL